MPQTVSRSISSWSLEEGEKVQSVPPGLNKSEARFVRDLKAYWTAEKDKSLSGMDVFLLRNLSRGSGVGFFDESGFYPDFILWILDGKKQRIIFIEPHGMLYEKAYVYDEKARLHERLPALAMDIGLRSKKKNISLDSFIISATAYDELYQRYDDGTWTREKFAGKHILFLSTQGAYNYIEHIFKS